VVSDPLRSSGCSASDASECLKEFCNQRSGPFFQSFLVENKPIELDSNNTEMGHDMTL
jgi:hypothetical protein